VYVSFLISMQKLFLIVYLICKIEATNLNLKKVIQSSIWHLCNYWDIVNNFITLQQKRYLRKVFMLSKIHLMSPHKKNYNGFSKNIHWIIYLKSMFMSCMLVLTINIVVPYLYVLTIYHVHVNYQDMNLTIYHWM